MSLHGGGGWGGGGWDTALQIFSELHEWPNKPYQGSFLAVNPQNVDINIHLVGHFEPVGHLSASTKAI